MDDKTRKSANELRLNKISPSIRAKVAAVLKDLESHGYQPLIDSGVWRSPAEQMEKYKAGYSKVTYSFHNATTKDGKPDSLAADITDARWGWDSPKKFWLMLASSALAHGLDSGIFWGLSVRDRQKIHTAISKKDWNAKVELGWDTAHVEVHGISLAAAKRGVRPA